MKFPNTFVNLLGSCLVIRTSVLGWGLGRSSVTPVDPILSSPELELVVSQVPALVSKAHEAGRKFIRSLDTASSCTRNAAGGLIRECSALEAPNSKSRIDLEVVKNLYAARLAVCELRDAGVSVPAECTLEVPEASGIGSFTFRSNIDKAVSRCLHALYLVPQSWDSYSNNRQNAVVICQAARPEAERDELIATFRSLIENHEASEAAVREQLQFANEQLAAQRALAEDIQAFSVGMKHELQRGFEAALQALADTRDQAMEREADFSRVFANIVAQTQEEMQSLVQGVLAPLQEAGLDVAAIFNAIQEHGQSLTVRWQADIEMKAQLAANLGQFLTELTLQVHDLCEGLLDMQVMATTFNDQQRENQMVLVNGSKDALAAFSALQASAVETTSALEQASAGFIPSLANSFHEFVLMALSWFVVRVAWIFFGLRSADIIIGIVFCTLLFSSTPPNLAQITNIRGPILLTSSWATLGIIPVAILILFCVNGIWAHYYLRRPRVNSRLLPTQAGSKLHRPLTTATSAIQTQFQYYHPADDTFKSVAP